MLENCRLLLTENISSIVKMMPMSEIKYTADKYFIGRRFDGNARHNKEVHYWFAVEFVCVTILKAVTNLWKWTSMEDCASVIILSYSINRLRSVA
jgi:hypothetical protein